MNKEFFEYHKKEYANCLLKNDITGASIHYLTMTNYNDKDKTLRLPKLDAKVAEKCLMMIRKHKEK